MAKKSAPMAAEWLDAGAAAELLGVERRHIRRLARDGLLSVRRLPGVRPRYRRDEIERLAAASVRPATAPK